ncbi:MAG: hypothetical protein ACJ8AW_32545 [Rhodopila sp.]
MTTYNVVRATSSGFNIEIISDGVRQTMLGFDTEADALAWVEADQAHDRAYPPASLGAEI